MTTRKMENLREKNGRCYARTKTGNRCKRAAASPDESFCSIDGHNDENHIHNEVEGLAERVGVTEVTESKETNDVRLLE